MIRRAATSALILALGVLLSGCSSLMGPKNLIGLGLFEGWAQLAGGTNQIHARSYSELTDGHEATLSKLRIGVLKNPNRAKWQAQVDGEAEGGRVDENILMQELLAGTGLFQEVRLVTKLDAKVDYIISVSCDVNYAVRTDAWAYGLNIFPWCGFGFLLGFPYQDATALYVGQALFYDCTSGRPVIAGGGMAVDYVTWDAINLYYFPSYHSASYLDSVLRQLFNEFLSRSGCLRGAAPPEPEPDPIEPDPIPPAAKPDPAPPPAKKDPTPPPAKADPPPTVVRKDPPPPKRDEPVERPKTDPTPKTDDPVVKTDPTPPTKTDEPVAKKDPKGVEIDPAAHRRDLDDLVPASGDAVVRDSIERALKWLASNQAPDGRWSSKTFQGRPGWDEGVTAIAILAFVEAGHKLGDKGPYGAAIDRGLTWLRATQKPYGPIGFRADRGASIYNHAFATQALCAALADAERSALRDAAKRAVGFCLRAQNSNLGWKYGVKTGKNDTAVTCAMVEALVAARRAKLEVPPGALRGAGRWFSRVTGRTGYVGYESAGGGSSILPENEGKYRALPTLTAAALACRLASGASPESSVVRQGGAILGKALPAWSNGSGRSSINFYYWRYGSIAARRLGKPLQEAWSRALRDALIPHQAADGSWPPEGEWAKVGGKVYATATNARALCADLGGAR